MLDPVPVPDSVQAIAPELGLASIADASAAEVPATAAAASAVVAVGGTAVAAVAAVAGRSTDLVEVEVELAEAEVGKIAGSH